MRVNLDKCVTLQCNRTINPHLTNYLVENYTLKNVNQHLYLGVMLNKTMSFTTHINSNISKASKMLNFVKRNLSSCLKSTKEKAYLSLVRPTLEYASSVWDPYQSVHITNIEKIQKRAARWVLHDYSRHSSITSMLQQLQWPSLESSRMKYAFFTRPRTTSLPFKFPSTTNLTLDSITNPPLRILTFKRHHTSTASSLRSTINEWNTLPSFVATSDSIATF